MSENQRTRRVTYTQLLHLWEFLNEHREVATGFNKSAQAREHSKRMWQQAAAILNSTGEGAVKTGPEWSKYWVDYKAKLKRKNGSINHSHSRTGGGPGNDLELSEIERQFLTILGEDFGLGLPGIQVNPFPIQEQADSDRPSTVQSSTDEGAVYLNVNFSDNENIVQESVENIPDRIENVHSISILAQAPSHQSPQQHQHSHSSSTQALQTNNSSQQQANISTSEEQANTRANTPPQTPQQQQRQRSPLRTRRRRRSQRRMTAADAREQLVTAAQQRAQGELANSRSIQQAVRILDNMASTLGNMASTLERIESRLTGEAPTTDS